LEHRVNTGAKALGHARWTAWIPVLTGVAVFGLISALYLIAPHAYLGVLAAVGVNPWSHPFIDSEFMYAMKRCWLAGVDVYRAVPCDIVPGNKMAYSPLWQRLPFLPSDNRLAAPIGVGTDLILIFSVMLLPPARSLREVIALSLAMISTMVVFCLERNNIDVWIYLMIVVGGVLLARSKRPLVAYGLFLLAALLKYYPVVALGLALKDRPKRLVVVASVSAVTLLIFVVAFHHELAKSFANVPGGSPFTDMVGVVNLPRAIAILAGEWGYVTPEHGKVLEVILRALAVAFVCMGGLALAALREFRESFESLSDSERCWLVLGALIVAGCYLVIQSVGYRGIYLLIVLSGLFPLIRSTAEGPLRQRLVFATLSIVPMMWMEGLRRWADLIVVNLPSNASLFFNLFVWLCRELLWLNLACVLMGVIFAFLRQNVAPTLAAKA
jgi:hypothetical protein